MSEPAPSSAGLPLPDFLDGPADLVAERLLGCLLERNLDGERSLVRIVETEAYDQEDPASHTFVGVTDRNRVMFGPSGRLYVYLSYGIHHCCNVVAGPDGFGAAALIRGVEPIEGIELLERRRGRSGPTATNGPGKLCQALVIDRGLNGHDLRRPPLRLLAAPLRTDERAVRDTRIGITKAAERPRRFLIEGSRYVSRPARPD